MVPMFQGVYNFKVFYMFVTSFAANIIKMPMNKTEPLGNTAQFNCTAVGIVPLTYFVNSKTIAEVASIGVKASEPDYSNFQTSVSLFVPATKGTNNWPVVCITYLPNGTLVDSPPAYLHVQGLC